MFTTILALFLVQANAGIAKQDPLKDDGFKVFTAGKSTVAFYGFLRLDILYDTDRPDKTQIPQYILSKDLSEAGGENDFTMHPRLTRFGLDLDGPNVEPLGNAKVTGKLEIDFYNLLPAAATSNTSNSREFIRMRHGWLKLGWESFSLLAGQREDVISPLAPTPNNDLVMWNAGNLGDRRPQLRGEYQSSGITATAMIGLTGADDSGDSDSDGYLDGEASGVPTVQGRIGYEVDGWVEKKKINAGVWGHWAEEEVDSPGDDDVFRSDAIGLDLTLPLHERLTFYGEVWAGKNLDDVRGGIAQGVVSGKEIQSKGGWIELHFKATNWWTPVVGGSLDDPDDEHLSSSGRDRNQIFWIANRMKFGPITIGFDYLNWTTEYVGSGIEDGQDHRFNAFIQYTF